MKLGLIGERKIDHGAAIGPQLYLILRECIIQNDIQPGSRISESEIARLFSVSRQPVREAFNKLAEEDLLEIRPQRGTFVCKISSASVVEARFVREAIEADIVKILAEDPDKALISELRKQLANHRQVCSKERKRFMELDDLFHQTLAEGAGKTYAWYVVEGLKAQMDRVRFLSLLKFPRKKVIDQHTAIVDAIEAGDVQQTEAAIRSHMREVLVDLPAIAESNPEFFDGTGT